MSKRKPEFDRLRQHLAISAAPLDTCVSLARRSELTHEEISEVEVRVMAQKRHLDRIIEAIHRNKVSANAARTL